MKSVRSSVFPLLISAVLTAGCEAGISDEIQPQNSDEFDLEKSAQIDAKYCAISGVTIGSTYQDVVATFGTPPEGSEQELLGPQSGVKFLEYKGIFASIANDSVTAVGSETADHGLSGGVSPTSSRDEVMQILGESLTISGQGLEVLSYQCGDTAPSGRAIMVAIRIIGDEVESISIVLDAKD